MNRNTVWKICGATVAILVVLTFTPLVTPPHQADPFFLGMPYTLWVGIILSLVLLFLTVLGSLVHPGRGKDDK